MDDTTRKLLMVVGVLLLVGFGLSMLTGGMMGGHMVGPRVVADRGWMWGVGMGLGMLLFWGALIVGIVLLVRFTATSSGPQSHGTPLDVLKRRYAAGEITREQYEQTRRDLDEGAR
jgi:putative membrane protein